MFRPEQSLHDQSRQVSARTSASARAPVWSVSCIIPTATIRLSPQPQSRAASEAGDTTMRFHSALLVPTIRMSHRLPSRFTRGPSLTGPSEKNSRRRLGINRRAVSNTKYSRSAASGRAAIARSAPAGSTVSRYSRVAVPSRASGWRRRSSTNHTACRWPLIDKNRSL